MTFSIITATYNRAHRIHRVYESLQHQTFRDFEWIIIDDGSTDNTSQLVKQWETEANFPITYIQKTNGGKHTAVNVGITYAKGDYIILLDSDDACVPEALETFYKAWEQVDNPKIGVIAVLCMDQQGKLIGTRFPRDIIDSDHREMVFRYRMKGDKWECYKREIFFHFPFPEPKNIKVFPESILLNEIARKYKTRYINKILRIYYNDGANTSLVRITDPSKNSAGSRLKELSILNRCISYFFWAPDLFFASAVKYARACIYSNIHPYDQFRDLSLVSRFLWFFAYPIARLIVKIEIKYRTNVSGKIKHFE